MPLSPRSTGFSDDGLSYSVAGDYNKLLGQALANYEARVGNPRSFQESDADYAARVSAAPDILGNELAPLGISTGLSRRAPAVQARTLAPGSTAGHFDPLTNKWVVDFTAPQPPEKEVRYKAPTSVNRLGQPESEMNLTLPEWKSMYSRLPDRVRTNAPITGLMDLYEQQFGSPTNTATIVKPGQVGKAPAKEQRTKGTIYTTPRGDLKWTGTGWITP